MYVYMYVCKYVCMYVYMDALSMLFPGRRVFVFLWTSSVHKHL